MDFLYQNMHLEQKKWMTTTQITMEEDINVPDSKPDCVSILLKNAEICVDEVHAGRDQVSVKGSLQYQILYETKEGTGMEQICGNIPFEEVMNADGAAPGELPGARGMMEDFKVSMINTRKIAIQSVIMLRAWMYQMAEEEWPYDLVCEEEKLEKKRESEAILQLVQKKTDVFRIKEEVEIPGSYPAIQKLLWNQVDTTELEVRPMDGKVSLKGELFCYIMYEGQGASPIVKTVTRKIPFHGSIDCSGCKNDSIVSFVPSFEPAALEIKKDADGEDRNFYLDMAMNMQIRIYEEEEMHLLKDAYSTKSEIELQEKTVMAPVICIAREGKYKLKQNHKMKEGNARLLQIMHVTGTILSDQEVWEDNRLLLSGGVQFQILYFTGEEEMPYAVTECLVPYQMEMEGMEQERENAAEKPSVLVEARLEQTEASLVDNTEIEVRGILHFYVLVNSTREESCVGQAERKPLDTEKYIALPGIVYCFAEKDTPVWDYGKQYYLSVEEVRKLNDLDSDIVPKGKAVLLVKGAEG